MAQKSDKSGRYYEFDNDPRQYVSVTTFLGIIGKPFLMPWAAKMERELIRKLAEQGKSLQDILEYLEPKQPYGYQLYTEGTSELGSKIHKAIDYTLKDLKLPRLTKQERMVYDKWLEWWRSQCFELLGAEQVVYHEGLGYAGTMDALVITESGKGSRRILDWKTGKNHYTEHELQNLAYQWTFEEPPAGGGQLVYLPKDKDIWTVEVPVATSELMRPVLDALGLWRWANNKPWRN